MMVIWKILVFVKHNSISEKLKYENEMLKTDELYIIVG